MTDGGAASHRRAVVLVGNPAAPYSRSLRIARTLDAAGFEVEIAAVAGGSAPLEEREGPILVRRYRPSGPFAGMAVAAADPGGGRGAARRRPLPIRAAAALRRWLLWPHTVRGWWATLARDLPPADLYHACGSLTVSAALAARKRDRRAGRSSVVIYDAIDDVARSNNVLAAPVVVRRWIAWRERRWARAADARLTVNDDLAAALERSWRTARPVVVPNWPELPAGWIVGHAEDRIRADLDLPASTRVVLFQGRLGPNLGLDEAAEAILHVPDAVLCLLGFGRGYETSRARDLEPRFAGRHRTLPAVHPDAVVAWTASADVALIPLPPVSANQRAATPNKLWEAVAAGTPVVVGPGLPAMARIVEADDLGLIARSLEPDDLAAAIRTLLDVTPDAAAERRRRIAAVAAQRYSWSVAASRYRSVVEALVPGQPAGAAGR
ncbi:MAG TPA: glycosyltransferase [Candidatus Limnocylindrales bacterium]|nr:glycosyltransferase [Candidatus Limnocylindrales bacterium]